MRVRDRLAQVAMERELRRSTVLSYRRFLNQIDILDTPVEDISHEDLLDRLWAIDNPNSRRSTIIALRSVLGLTLKIPKGIPRRYDLPDEDTLRMAMMLSPHEIRGLIMMYAGLRIGETCAITGKDVKGDRLLAVKQVQQLHETGKPTTTNIRPVKSIDYDPVIPYWLAERIAGITETAKPDCVRESLRRAGLKMGIHINPHMLRHWYGTYLLGKGAPMGLVSKQMRHSHISITLGTYEQYDEEKVIHDIFD